MAILQGITKTLNEFTMCFIGKYEVKMQHIYAKKRQQAALGIVADTPHPPEAERSMSGKPDP